MRQSHREPKRQPAPDVIADIEEVIVVEDWERPLSIDPGATLVEATATLVEAPPAVEVTDATEADLPAFAVPTLPAGAAPATSRRRPRHLPDTHSRRLFHLVLLTLDLVLLGTLALQVRERRIVLELARTTRAARDLAAAPRPPTPRPKAPETVITVEPKAGQERKPIPPTPSPGRTRIEPATTGGVSRPPQTTSDAMPTKPNVAGPDIPSPVDDDPVTLSVGSQLRAADQALAAGDFDGALRRFEEVLARDPDHAEAGRGVLRARGERAAVGRLFLTLPTVRHSQSSCNPFERGAKCASRRELDCKIEFALTPAAPGQGDTYTVEVFALNTGERKLKVEAADAVISASGSRVASRLAAGTVDIPRGERRRVGGVTAVWEHGTTSWRLEATLTDQEGDRYRAELAWEPRPSR